MRLLIKYQGRPTTTIAVGDPLDFKLETQEGRNLLQVRVMMMISHDDDQS